MPLREPTWQEVFDQLNTGRKWGSSVITYSFPVTASGLYAEGEGPGFTTMLASGQVAARLALSLWDDLIIADFREILPGSNYLSSDIEFGMTTTGINFAVAYFPNTGSIWFNSANSSGGSNLVSPSIGQFGFFGYIHEIGHALGLQHAGDYDGPGGRSPSNFADSTVLTIMSYFGPNWQDGQGDVAWADWVGADGNLYSPQTPMLNDIYVIQRIYGAETTTRIENTTYGFNSNITGDIGQIYDFTRNSNPILTIYDSAGIDTLDLSGWATSSIINIGQGGFSSCNSMTNNIAIAFGCDIENARGGAGNDTIYGNALNNILYGGAGNDELFGLGGDDTIYGGLGSDTVVFTLARSSYQITPFQNYLRVQGSSGTIVLYEIENLRFSDVTVSASSFFQSSDTTAPTVTSFSPTDAATGVAVGNNIVLTFSEAIARGTGTITVRSGSATGTIVESFDAATSNRISISGSTLTIDPTNNLAGNTRYFVVFSSGNVRDLAGNAYAGTSTYDFTTARTATTDDFPNTAATTGVVTIGGAATTGSIETARDVDLFRVSLTAGVTYTFNLNATSGSLDPVLVLRNSALEQLAENDDYGSSLNSQITFTASSSGTYYLQARSFGANIGTYSLQGAAADTTAPTVSAFTPADGATAVAVGANIVLTFSENIAKGTGTITLRSGSATGAIVESFDAASSNRLTVSGLTLTIDPTSDLSANTQYFVVFTSGNIKDTAGNAYAGISTYDFITAAADTTAPTVTSFSPTDAATGVAVGNNIVLTFSEAIARGTGTITVRSGSATGTIVESFDAATSNRISISGSTLTIDPTNNLAGNTRYFVVFSSGNVRDLAGNAYAGTSTYDFTTARTATTDDFPNTAATTGVVTIGGAATTGSIETARDVDLFRVSLTAGVTYTFNLNATSGSLDPVLVLRNSALEQLAENDDYGSSLNSQITFTASSSGTYYLQARSFGANIGTYSLQGAAADTTAPTVSAFTPADGATAVAVGANIVLTFSENIAKGTGTITLRSGSATGAIVESFDAASSNRLTVSGLTLTIDPTSDLSANTQYFVVFTSGNIKDTAGNAYAGISTYDFITAAADTTAPTVTSFSPTDAATGVAVGNNIVLTFSEAIARGTGTITVRSGSATGTIVESFDAATSNRISISGSTLTIDPTNNLAGNTRYFVVFSSGNVRDLAGNAYAGTSTYDFTTARTATTDDFPNTAATTGVVTIGGAATTGSIETARDVDLFRVSLTAGVTYTFNLNATSGSLDPVLVLRNSALEQLAENDDYGSSLNSQITFTASSSGTYYLQARSFGANIGTYSLQGRIGSTSAIAQSALSVAPADSLGRSDGMAPETDLAMIPPSKSNEPGNQIGIIEAEILLALANSNDPFASEHLALQNLSFNQGVLPQSIVLEHSPDTTNYSVADAFHFGSGDVLEHFRNDDAALTRTEFNAVIFDPAHHWTANSAFDPGIYNGDEIIFDVTEFGSFSTANRYHQVDFIL